MFPVKCLRYSGILCVLLALFCFTFYLYNKNVNQREEKKIITVNQRMPEQFASVPYLKIPSLGIEKIIKEEMGKDILDHYYIGIWNQEKDIRKIGHLILAGHNVKNVFGNLYKINIGDLIYIYDRSEEYIYEVTEKKEIGVTETEYLKGTKKRSVSLITCTKDDQVRLYVHAKIKRA